MDRYPTLTQTQDGTSLEITPVKYEGLSSFYQNLVEQNYPGLSTIEEESFASAKNELFDKIQYEFFPKSADARNYGFEFSLDSLVIRDAYADLLHYRTLQNLFYTIAGTSEDDNEYFQQYKKFKDKADTMEQRLFAPGYLGFYDWDDDSSTDETNIVSQNTFTFISQ